MELSSIDNDLENKMHKAAAGSSYSTFVRNIFLNGKWLQSKSFRRYGCEGNISPGSPMFRAFPLVAVMDRSGYWLIHDYRHKGSFVCVAEARSDFTPPGTQQSLAPATPIKPTHGAPCAPHHAPDSAGECRWTGPTDACVQLVDFYKGTWFASMPNFPRETFFETVKVIVRRGCMFFGHMHPNIENGNDGNDYTTYNSESKKKVNFAEYTDGLSRATCFCDPTEATINGQVPAPPRNFESKYCGELITSEGRRKMLEIPIFSIKNSTFSRLASQPQIRWQSLITEIIVRQHCWATLYWVEARQFFKLTLPTSGYGRHKVASYFNGMLSKMTDGTRRVGPDRKTLARSWLISTVALDGESDRASRLYVLRLHAPKRSSPGSYSYDNYLELVGQHQWEHHTDDLSRVNCFCDPTDPTAHDNDSAHVNTNYTDGLSRVNCFCDPTEATLNSHVPALPPGNQCIEHHVFDEVTKAVRMEIRQSKFCGDLITHDGRRQMLEIPNWRTNRRYDADHYKDAKKTKENFHISVTDIIVRQQCWATLYWTGYNIFVASNITLATSGYGKHKVASKFNGLLANEEDGTHRIVCECIR
ncbi:hypothetical protein PRIPAC_78289 [Pristionchus pacificus]|uniref:Uncharacterized protein n=1 Tax=Pristionchus pacificus TaxID=54126 RepID=A0A2A6CN12_PRIPA|nr:hypothetical protein PRIPAC_78289 [Pristionchus pacificus]|eukprot:PDM79488.1 hypothetical protein PRIPAC_32067 [Pristionchus pacificus]